MFRAKGSFELGDELAIERLGRVVVRFIREQIREIVQRREGVGIRRPGDALKRLPGAA